MHTLPDDCVVLNVVMLLVPTVIHGFVCVEAHERRLPISCHCAIRQSMSRGGGQYVVVYVASCAEAVMIGTPHSFVNIAATSVTDLQ